MYSVCVYNLYTVLFIVYMLIITIYFKRICTNVIYIIYIVLEARGESVAQHCSHQLHLWLVCAHIYHTLYSCTAPLCVYFIDRIYPIMYYIHSMLYVVPQYFILAVYYVSYSTYTLYCIRPIYHVA